MELKKIEKSYSRLLIDSNYDRLSLELNKPNIFKILGVSNYELKHSNFLAWLLDPNESHELGGLFLSRYLTDLLLDERSKGISLLQIGNIEHRDVEVRREWKNIDILIITQDFVVCIENKIWAKESKTQLEKYKEIIDENFPTLKKIFVFLTPYGDEASINEVYINSDYSTIIEILETIVENRRRMMSISVLQYIEDYLSILKQYLMGNDNTNKWAVELYKNHKELFDFVWENKPDFHVDFANIITPKIEELNWKIGSKNKGFVRFYPESLHELILNYKRANGWPDKEAFLFEIDFHKGKNIIFRTVVSPPMDYEAYDERIVEILGTLEGAQKKLGLKWKCHFTKNKKWELETIMNNWNQKHENDLDKFIEEFKPIVQLVESKLLDHKDELLKLKKGIDNI